MNIIEKYLKGEISIGLASELMNMTIIEFVKYLKSIGIKPFEAEASDIEIINRLFKEDD